MDYLSHDILVRAPGGPFHARVTGAAIKALWRQESGKNLGAGIVNDHREMLEVIGRTKASAGHWFQPGIVEILPEDLPQHLR